MTPNIRDPLPDDWQDAFELWRQATYAPLQKRLDTLSQGGPLTAGWTMDGRDAKDGWQWKDLDQVRQAWRQQLTEATFWQLAARMPTHLADAIVFDLNEFSNGRAKEGLRAVWRKDAPKKEVRKWEAYLTAFRVALGTSREALSEASFHRRGQGLPVSVPTGLSLTQALAVLQPEVLVAYERRVLEAQVQDTDLGHTRKPRL